MIIEEVNVKSPSPDLQRFVAMHRLLFHTQTWLSSYNSGQIKQCMILNQNREVIGCFVYYEFFKARFRCIITPPFTPHIALFCVNPALSVVGRNSFEKDLGNLLGDYFKSRNADYLSINLPAEYNDVQPFLWKDYGARSRFTYHLNLEQAEDELMVNLSSEKRKSLNKARKDGLAVAKADDPKQVYELVTGSLSRNAKNKNTAIISNIISQYLNTEQCIAYVAKSGEKTIAASFCVCDTTSAIYLFGGYDATAKHHGAGVSCMWHAILEAKRRGLKIFDFEGSMDPRIERYFREFGPELVTYQCVEKVKPFFNLLLRIKGHKPL